MSRRRKALFFFLGLSLVLGLIAASIVAKVRRGEDLLWIAELWMPAAVLSIGVVVGIEYLIGPTKPAPVAPAASAPVTAEASAYRPAKQAARPKAALRAKTKAKPKKPPKK